MSEPLNAAQEAAAKVKLAMLVALTASLLATSAGARAQQKEEQVRRDNYGDPLPPGVLARLGALRFRHEGGADQLLYSPDGKILAGNGESGVLMLWDAATGRELHRLPVPWPLPAGTGRVFDFSPDSTMLAAVDHEKGIIFWEVSTGKRMRKTAMPPGKIAAENLRFSPDGKILAVVPMESDKIHLLDVKSGKYIRQIGGRCTALYGLAFSPDGRCLVLGTEKGRLRRWDLTTGQELSPLSEAFWGAWEFSWSPDSRVLALRRSASEITAGNWFVPWETRLWDVPTGTRLTHFMHLKLPASPALVRFAPDGRTMLTADPQGVIHLWEVATGKERGQLRGHLSLFVQALALSSDGRMLVSGGQDSQVLVWDLTGRTPDGQWHTVRHPPEKCRAAWKALAGDDATAAYVAMWQLAADPEGAMALLRERLQPVARPKPGQVVGCITALDSEKFAERERAARELETLGESAASELRQTLTRKPSLEVRRRVEAILAKLDHPPIGVQLQALRGIEALEHIGTKEARTLLRRLADGAPAVRLTQEAKASLRRSGFVQE